MKRVLLLTLAVVVLLGSTSIFAKDYVLSVSWQPAFCETKPDKVECKTQTSSRFDATHFTLHGLWPQEGEWCGVSRQAKKLDKQKQWRKLDKVKLSDGLQASLNEKMPGTASFLDRHEWTRHGSCAGVTQEEFFQISLSLLDSVNVSSLRKLIAENIGKSIELDNLFASVEQDYGESALHSIEFLCTNIDRKQNLIEIRYHLASGDKLPSTVSSKTLGEPARETPEGQLCDSGSVHIDVAGK